MDFAFLKSNRFWAMVVIAVAVYLEDKGIFGQAEMLLVNTILAGHVAIRTVDRVADKLEQ